VRSIIIVIMTIIIVISYADNTSVRGTIDGSINFIRSTVNDMRQVAPAVEETVETVEEVVDSET